MSQKDRKELYELATQVYNKIIAMQQECKLIRLETQKILNK